MPYRGFSGGGFVGNFLSTTLLEQLRPAADNAGRQATVGDPTTRAAPYRSDGTSWKAVALIDSTGSLVDGAGNVLGPYTAREKIALLNPRPVGFNYYSLVYEVLIGSAPGIANRGAHLDWISATGATVVRFALPVFDSAQYLSGVHNTAAMPATMSDSNLRSTYVTALDTCMDALAARGLKAHVCDGWGQDYLPTALGETRAVAYGSTTSKTAVYSKSAAEWFFRRYKDHAAFGVYSLGNEYVTDAAGITGPTEAQLGAWFTFVAAGARAIDPRKLITADLLHLAVSNSASRITLDQFAVTLRTLCAGLDAYCLHFYGSGFAYVGYSANEDAAFPNTNATDLGYEGLPALMESLRSIADADGKPLIIGEFGVSTAEEADADPQKKNRVLRVVSQYADYCMLWNVQDATLAGTIPNQTTWFISTGTTRATTFSGVVSPLNLAKQPVSVQRIAGGLKGLRNSLQPRFAVKGARASQGYIQFTSSSVHASSTGYSLLMWLRLDAPLNSGELIMGFNGDNTYGLGVAANAVANALGFYVDMRYAGGSRVNSQTLLPDVVVGEWNHLCFSSEGVNGSAALRVMLNGLYWRTIPAAGYPASISTGINMFIGGYNAGNGAPVSFQDVCLAGSVSMQDVWDHMSGKVLPQSFLHMRARPNKSVIDLSRNAVALSIGSGATVVQTG